MSLSRRDLLAAFLGAPFAAAACSRKKRVPDGELAFRPEELGHRVRDERVPELPADRFTNVGVVIVGGGIAGLSAAWRLLEKGYEDFVLLELERQVGGTARSGANSVSAYPWGAHYITAPMKENAALVALLDAVGIVEGKDDHGEPIFKEEVLCREPQERVFAGGQWHEGLYLHEGESAEEKAQFARFKERIEAFAIAKDERGRRHFAVPTSTGSDVEAVTSLDKITMAEWLTREKLDSERLEWLVDYACRDDFGARSTQTSAYAGIHYYASRLLGAGKDPQAVLTWPSGNGWLVQKLNEKVRAKVKVGFAVADISVQADGSLDVVAVGGPPSALGFHCKKVIFASPQMVARRVLRPYRDAPPSHLDAFEYGAWAVANITLSARPKLHVRGEKMMAWDNVVYDSPSLGYVNATHQSGRDHGPTVITYYQPLCDDDPKAARKRLYAAGRDEWADVALADLERVHPDIRDLATRVDVVRWGHAMARPSPGFFFGKNDARRTAAKPFRGIHFAHTDLSGIALFEEAFFHGTRAADEVLTALRT
jgi:protoporphyrinogen oxidase